MGIKHIANVEEFNSEVKNYAGVVLVDFWAPWCGPCKLVAPELEKVATERQEVKVVKVNVDELPTLKETYGVQGIPSLVLFNAGEEVDRLVGFRPAEDIVALLLK